MNYIYIQNTPDFVSVLNQNGRISALPTRAWLLPWIPFWVDSAAGEEEAAAAADISLSEAEIERIEAPYRPHVILGHQ